MTWTKAERALLRRFTHDVGVCIANPEYGIESLRLSERSGGGHGFGFKFTKAAITGTWHEFIPDAWYPNGTPYRFHHGRLLAEAKVSHTRLRRWCEALPADTRAQALTWWATYPEDHSDWAALAGLVLSLLAEPEPADLLELLALGGQ
ncbi:hypothetical protein ACFROC_29165 [Nocardia tengchongensis]|uniref:hypothetical protein n=1 Tax=Nocardia tengchongensis TaxID=2055889 RepID=UPI003673D2FA